MKNILFGIFLLFCSALNSQFLFETFQEDYVSLSEPQILTFGIWDDPELFIPLGFEFVLFGEDIDALYTYTGYHNELYTVISEDSTVNVLIPLFADIIDPGYSNNESEATISYSTIGEEPYRICIIQWENCAFYNEGDVNNSYYDRVNFQTWLYETTNVIEYHYGEMNVTNPEIDFDTDGIYIGLIEKLNVLQGQQCIENEWHLTGENSSFIELTNQITAINDIFTNSSLLLDVPSNGTVYRFSNENVTNIRDNSSILTVDATPTVFNTILTIKVNSPSQYNLVNITGQKIVSGDLIKGETQIFTSQISSGIYFLQIISGEDKKTIKLVKK